MPRAKHAVTTALIEPCLDDRPDWLEPGDKWYRVTAGKQVLYLGSCEWPKGTWNALMDANTFMVGPTERKALATAVRYVFGNDIQVYNAGGRID